MEEPPSVSSGKSALAAADLEPDPGLCEQTPLGTSSWPSTPWPGGWPCKSRLTRCVPPAQYQVEPAQLVTRRLQVSVWHLGTLARRVFLGEVIVPLATWDFEDSTTQSFRWYPLRAKVMSGWGLSDPTPLG